MPIGLTRIVTGKSIKGSPMTISETPIFMGCHRIPSAPALSLPPEVACMVPDGGHAIIPNLPGD
jgi:hypothetical protein